MATSQYDVVVIGGGIHGAGVAQAVAAAGHSVLVLEQTALAAATSSCSSKLIHGGLRYLESFELKLVYECLRERRLLLKLAPELVTLKDFYIPVYKSTRRRPWQLRIGLFVYALLGRFAAGTRFRSVPKSEWPQLDGLKQEGLQRVFQYQDGQTDDAKLVAAVMGSAVTLGATVATPATFIDANIKQDGVVVHYQQQGQRHEVWTKALVNAAGPWVSDVLSKVKPDQAPLGIDLVQGTHLEIRGPVPRGIYYVESPSDGRAVFVMPWYDRVLVGTTEHVLEQGADSVAPTQQEKDYLCAVLKDYFPAYKTPGAIESAWAGARVLPRSAGRAFKRSRETIFWKNRKSKPRLISIYGGKLTAYRATAEKTMRHLAAVLPRRAPKASTRELRLYESDSSDSNSKELIS